MTWLDELRRGSPSGWPVPGTIPYEDPVTGWFYMSNATSTGGVDSVNTPPTEYYSFDPAHASPGVDYFTVYDLNGNVTDRRLIRKTGNGLDLLLYGIVAAVTMGYGLPMLMAGGGAVASGGGAALVGSSAGMVAPAGLGAAAAGTGLWGSLTAVEIAALTGGAATVAATSSAATLSSVAATASKIIGAVSAALGLAPQGEGDAAQLTYGGTSRPLSAQQSLVSGVNDSTLIWGAVALAGVLYFNQG